MCGISGLFNHHLGNHAPAALRKSLDAISHRGPDDWGFHEWDQCVMGMRRLSIIDLETGHQPIFNEDRTKAIVFNGEIYNYRELHSRLVGLGHKFQTASDTEVILHLYEEYGEKMLSYLRGMFAIAIWDDSKKELFLARDRFGKKPLYYFRTLQGTFMFASELKALKILAKRNSVSFAINQQGIYDYLSFGTIPQPETIYKDVYLVSPGSWMKVSAEKMISEFYWSLDRSKKIQVRYEEAVEKTRELVKESVALRLRSDVPLGVFLSGGMDSSAVVYEAAQMLGSSLQTFTIGTDDPALNEAEIAKRTADRLGVQNHAFKIDVVPEEEIFNVVNNYDQPFADSSAIPSMIVSRMASQHVKVVLNGDGGDEVFAGYRRYIASSQLDKWASRIPSGASRFMSTLTQEISVPRRSKLGLLFRFVRGLGLDPSERYLAWTCDQLLEKDKQQSWLGEENLLRTEQKITTLLDRMNGYSFLDKQLELDRNFNLLGLLVKMDIATMAASVEGRSPLLDHKLAEYIVSLPDEFKVGRYGKQVLRDAYKGRLSDEVIFGKKKGFEVPMQRWLKEDLSEIIQDLLLSPNSEVAHYLDRKWIRSMVEGKILKDRNWAYIVYALLILEIWMRKEKQDDTCA